MAARNPWCVDVEVNVVFIRHSHGKSGELALVRTHFEDLAGMFKWASVSHCLMKLAQAFIIHIIFPKA